MGHIELYCKIAKMQRAPVKPSTRRTSQTLELVHLDISGKVEPSTSGAIHTVAFLKDYTATSCVRLLKKKSELLQALGMYKNRTEVILKVHGFVIQNIRLDRAGENLSNDVIHYCNIHGIYLEYSLGYAPQSNGTAERLIQEHWTRTRTLLFASNLANKIWGEAMYFSNLLRNQLPTKRIKYEMPILLWNANKRLISAEYLNSEQKFSLVCIKVILHRIRNSYLGQF